MNIYAAAAHQDALQWIAQNWVGLLILAWFLGVFGWAGETWRRAVNHRREAAEVRHQRQVEIELARRGQLYQHQPARPAAPEPLPAAVIAAPPGALPVRGVPGECRHERIVPVIDGDGDLIKWVCANWSRCDAEFSKSVAIYDAG
jgi:hypothetical protein